MFRTTPARWGRLCVALSLSVSASGQVSFQHVTVDGSGPSDMHTKTVGDLNGDGFADLVVAGKGGELYWYEERSAHPGWTRHTITGGGLGGWSTDAECGDLDGDVDQDVLVSDWYTHKRIGWFENVDGQGGAFTFHPIGGPAAHDVELADFDGDGDLDVVTRNQGSDGGELELWRNDGAAASWTHATWNMPSVPGGEGLTVADLDRDGDPDVVVARFWFENTADFMSGGWVAHEYAPASQHLETLARVGDVDGDGRADIVTTPSEFKSGSGETLWFRAPLDPTSVPWTKYGIDANIETVTHSLGLADLDLDGDLDVVTAEMHQGGNPDEVRAYFNDDGLGGVWTKQVLSQSGSHSVRVVDVGGDGDFDVFGANWSATNQVDLWENDLRAPRVGVPFCHDGSACPCGNPGGLGEGCANSSGAGAALFGRGSARVSADDLVLVTAPVLGVEYGLFVMGDQTGSSVLGDGHFCLSGALFRFPPRLSSAAGAMVEGPGIVGHAAGHFPPSGHIAVGTTWYFQAWYRDNGGPCGQGFNESAALAVTFLP